MERIEYSPSKKQCSEMQYSAVQYSKVQCCARGVCRVAGATERREGSVSYNITAAKLMEKA